MIVEILDPRFRYDVNGLTEEQIITLSSEIRPKDPTFWTTYLFAPFFKDRVLEIRVHDDGSRSYYYTQRELGSPYILKLKEVIERERSPYSHKNLKFIVL